MVDSVLDRYGTSFKTSKLTPIDHQNKIKSKHHLTYEYIYTTQLLF